MYSPQEVHSSGSERDHDTNRERLLGNRARTYGSTDMDSAAERTRLLFDEAQAVPKGLNRQLSADAARMAEVQRDVDVDVGYRRLTATTVYLPVNQKWYRRIHIPGITSRSSPHSNAVHTTKYTVFTFLFKNLWEQFHRFANIYFLFILLLNFVPAIEAFGKEVAFIPLLFVLSVTAVKDIFEDYRRYRSDREVNTKICRVYDW